LKYEVSLHAPYYRIRFFNLHLFYLSPSSYNTIYNILHEQFCCCLEIGVELGGKTGDGNDTTTDVTVCGWFPIMLVGTACWKKYKSVHFAVGHVCRLAWTWFHSIYYWRVQALPMPTSVRRAPHVCISLSSYIVNGKQYTRVSESITMRTSPSVYIWRTDDDILNSKLKRE
jgi:hypothetical protein